MLLVALVATLASPGVARAEGTSTTTVTLDSVTLEPSRLSGFLRLRAYVSAMNLQGESLPVPPGNMRLMIGGSQLRAPYGIGQFAQSDADLSVVIVIETSVEYTEVLPVIQEVVAEELLAKLPDRAKVAIVGYGESVQGGRLAPLKTARAKLAGLSSDVSPADPALVESVESGLALFRRLKTSPPGRPMRKVLVLISDGRDRLGDRDRVTGAGQRANREGVRILSLAYSATNSRRPLLNLGELSRQSRGTFRWLRTGEKQSWQAQLQRVREQIDEQVVLTYFVENDEETSLTGKRVTASVLTNAGELVSNELKMPAPGCAKETCGVGQWCLAGACVQERQESGRGVLGWIGLLVGLAAAALVVLGLIGYVVSKRQAKGPPMPGVPGVPGQPGSVPPGAMPGMPVPVPGFVPGMPGAPGSQPPQPPQPSSVPPPGAVRGPQLYIASGPRTGQRVPLFHGFSIGKAPGSSLVIDDGFASTNHAQIGMDARGFCTIYDRGSTNGTFVNGVRVTEMPLEHGAALRIGGTELRFLAE